MRFSLDIPNFGQFSDPHHVVELAREVEAAGWDGFSLWDHILYASGLPVADPWLLLGAAAMATERIKLITMVTPLPRRRPWVVARQAVTLDQLSNGRLVLGVGIGYPPQPEFEHFGESGDERVRADMLDEGLEIINGMWTGEPFSFQGAHYRLEEAAYRPTPVQQPRIPVWVAGMWPFKRPFRRAARWDGVAPIMWQDGQIVPLLPHHLGEIISYLTDHRGEGGPFDVAIGLRLADDPAAAADRIADYSAAGATWARMVPDQDMEADDVVKAVRAGPPRR